MPVVIAVIVGVAAILAAPALPLSGRVPVAEANHEPPSFATPWDPEIPNFAHQHNIRSRRSGRWSDPATWTPLGVPRATDVVSIAAGHVVTLDSGNAVARVVGVSAQALLRFRPSDTAPTARLTVGTLQVMPGGALEVGTEAEPIAPQFLAEIVIADEALDLAADPDQFGTGLIGMGRIRMHGAARQPTFVRVAGDDPQRGAGALSLERAVSGWMPGDRLLLPDTRPAAHSRGRPDQLQHEVLELGDADSGRVLNLASGLAFDHWGAYNPDHAREFLPHVGNLTRNVVVRSANPQGTRGHVIFTDPRADIDIRYAGFYDLGRTTARAPIHRESNHIGRYALHMHHVMGPAREDPWDPQNPPQFTLIGNAIEGSPKWCLAIHDTHYGLARDNVVHDCLGAGIVTEDGSESHNHIDHNFAVRAVGSGLYTGVEIPSVIGRPEDLGFEGSPFWFRGTNNYVTDNVGAGSAQNNGYGFGGANFMVFQWNSWQEENHLRRIPRFPGASTAVPGEYDVVAVRRLPMTAFSGNESYGGRMGFEFWSPDMSPGFKMTDSIAWHNDTVSFHKYTFVGHVEIDGLVARGWFGEGSGIQDHTGPYWIIRRADIQGLWNGALLRPKGGGMVLENSYFRNDLGLELKHVRVYGAPNDNWIVNSTFADPPGQESIHIKTLFTPESGSESHDILLPYRILVYGHNGDPDANFRIYFSEQDPDAILLATGESGITRGAPERGQTNQYNWDRYGIAFGGEMAPCQDTRPGIVGFVCGDQSSAVLLTVAKAGSGSGTVTSDDDQIDCGEICAHEYERDVRVTLAATADPGSTFAGWDPVTCGATMVMDRNRACTATFVTSDGLTAVIAAHPTSGPAPLTVAFDGSGSSDPDGTIVAYQWDFGDGATAAGVTVDHTYPRPGSFTTTLTVVDDRGASASAAVVITVTASCGTAVCGPTITVEPQDRTVRVGGQATFRVTAQGTGSLRYQWQRDGVDIPGATRARYTTPPATLDDTGATFRCVVSDRTGRVTSRTTTLMVRGRP